MLKKGLELRGFKELIADLCVFIKGEAIDGKVSIPDAPSKPSARDNDIGLAASSGQNGHGVGNTASHGIPNNARASLDSNSAADVGVG